MKTIYISGGISDLPMSEVMKAFNAAKAHYARAGYSVVIPMELPHNHDGQWHSYMLEDLRALIACDEVAMLANWKESPGARIEHAFAERMRKPIHFFEASKQLTK